MPRLASVDVALLSRALLRLVAQRAPLHRAVLQRCCLDADPTPAGWTWASLLPVAASFPGLRERRRSPPSSLLGIIIPLQMEFSLPCRSVCGRLCGGKGERQLENRRRFPFLFLHFYFLVFLTTATTTGLFIIIIIIILLVSFPAWSVWVRACGDAPFEFGTPLADDATTTATRLAARLGRFNWGGWSDANPPPLPPASSAGVNLHKRGGKRIQRGRAATGSRKNEGHSRRARAIQTWVEHLSRRWGGRSSAKLAARTTKVPDEVESR